MIQFMFMKEFMERRKNSLNQLNRNLLDSRNLQEGDEEEVWLELLQIFLLLMMISHKSVGSVRWQETGFNVQINRCIIPVILAEN